MTLPVPLTGTGPLVVLSPHLDDAALSLGATIASLARAGQEVVVLTVLAGDPGSVDPPGVWDRRCGFASAGEAARLRRLEDRAACDVLGATPVWLPYGDEQQRARGGTDGEIWTQLLPHLDPAAAVLVPGHPLTHRDHAWLTRLVVGRFPADRTLLYAEQPYAANEAIGRGYSIRPVARSTRLGAATRLRRRPFRPSTPDEIGACVPLPVEWRAVCPRSADRRAKDEAIRAYASQFGVGRLGRLLLKRIRAYELVTGGEHVGAFVGAAEATTAAATETYA